MWERKIQSQTCRALGLGDRQRHCWGVIVNQAKRWWKPFVRPLQLVGSQFLLDYRGRIGELN